MTFCEMHKNCAGCPNRFVCKNNPFLPPEPINGKIGYYPAKDLDEWRSLPLPLRCSTWNVNIDRVVFNIYFTHSATQAKVIVHPEDVFRILFTLHGTDTLLYVITAVLINGEEHRAHWVHDPETGCYAIIADHNVVARQGGYQGHLPSKCYLDDDGAWKFDLHLPGDTGKIFYWG